ncbi:CMRF35-like molecule 7 [Eublepharis macularius]|uniref:CMRF35-like molecule 7 n=1 Tax=Eublepharis macularius TaxID=481883 RepID=A0AA97KV91_EUBMA|nr:CMRF35-like molecule 7 [Eublepharis macularius]
MKFFCGLIWTLLQGCWALEGPRSVTAPLGGSVSVLCQYGEGNEEYIKFWCKEASFRSCSSNHVVYTTGSEAEVKQNGISIKDNHASRIFRVTMDNLRQGDKGTYLCGVQRTRYDIWHPVEVIITSGTLSLSCIYCLEMQSSNIQILLLLLKIPIFLALIAAVIWVHICYKDGRSCRARSPEMQEENYLGSMKGNYFI